MSTGRRGLLGIHPWPAKRRTSGSIDGFAAGLAAVGVALPTELPAAGLPAAISAPSSVSWRAARSSPGENPKVVAIWLKRRRERSIAGLLKIKYCSARLANALDPEIPS